MRYLLSLFVAISVILISNCYGSNLKNKNITFDLIKRDIANKYDAYSNAEIDSLIGRLPKGSGFEQNLKDCKRRILITFDLLNVYIEALEKRNKTLLLDFYDVENFELFYSDEFIKEILSNKDAIWYIGTDFKGLYLARRINFIVQCWDDNYGKIQDVTHINPFYKLIVKDTIHAEPQFDFVSTYDWQNASLNDLPGYAAPFRWLDYASRESLEKYKKINILEMQAPRNVVTKEKIKFKNTIIDECHLSNGRFHGAFIVSNNTYQCKQLASDWRDKAGWEEYVDYVQDFKLVATSFLDVNNDNYMDVLLYFTCLNCGSQGKNKKVILTKTSRNKKMFELLD